MNEPTPAEPSPQPEPYESKSHFAVVFMSETKEGEKVTLRAVKRTKATIAAMKFVRTEVATLRGKAAGEAAPVRVYIVDNPDLERELRPYVKVI